MFSFYENRNTVKILVGLILGGCICDRKIVGRSKLVQLYEHGDIVMADKCFNVHDLFAMMDAAVNISTFKKKGNSISGKITYEIVYKRVHIASIIDLELNYHHI
jgi:hypothetical protein